MAKKKIVFVMNNFWLGGTEKLLLGLISKLCARYDITIATVLGPGEMESQFQKLPVTIVHLSPVIFANKTLPLKVFWLLAAPITFLRLLTFLIKVKPDVVATSLYQADVLGMTAARVAGVKRRIIIQHDIQEFGFFRKYFKYFLAIRPATHIVAVSNSVQSFLSDYWRVGKDKITMIWNGFEFSDLGGTAKTFDRDSITFGILGRLEPIKGHAVLFSALRTLKQEYGLAPKLLIAGGGSLESKLRAEARAQELNAKFLGPLMDVRGFFSSIDVLIAPSLEEGFGLVVLEGLAAGKLVVASDIGAFGEIILTGENGILFPKNDPRELALKLKGIIEQPEVIVEYRYRIAVWKTKKGHKYDLGYAAEQYYNLIESV